MPVYVDPLMNHGGSATFRWKDSCHMYADTLEELMEFATKKLRLKAQWFQNKRVPHFDLNASKHRLALSLGVIQHTRRQAVDFWVSKGWHSAKLREMEFADEKPVEFRGEDGNWRKVNATRPELMLEGLA